MKSYRYTSNALKQLGVRSWINARNWSTNIGGNWLDDRVINAMNEVAKTFVDMHELQAKVDEKIALLCQADEAHATIGAGASIEMAVAGCMAMSDYGKWISFPYTEGMKNEVLIPRGHNINYTPQWNAAGAKTVEYGIAGTLRSFKKELEAAITEKTCCLAYTFSYNNVPRGIIPFNEVVETGKKYGLPVVVDAASELPPVSNLQKFLKMGADIVCFSGGKAIQGPNNTGMLLGNGKGAEIIKYIRQHTFPHYGWSRGHKISKEQLVGFVVALEIFIKEGDQKYNQQYQLAEYIMRKLSGIKGVTASIIANDDKNFEHNMMPKVPRVKLEWDKKELGLSAEDLDNWMQKETPPIFLRNIHYYNYYNNLEWRLIDTYFLRSPEEEIIIDRILKFFNR